MKPKHLLVLVVGLVFALTSAVACADNYLVIKDKNGKCSVIKSEKEKTPATIGGPFKTKAEAEKAKEKLCPPDAPKKPDAVKKPDAAKKAEPTKPATTTAPGKKPEAPKTDPAKKTTDPAKK